MTNNNAKEIVEAGEKQGLSHQEMAKICGVSLGTISRWKTVGRARSRVIASLENQIKESPKSQRKFLDEASLEDLADRARELGFRITFSDERT
jgi:transposase